MNSIKEATAESHKRAEQTEIVKLIFGRKISGQQYASLLANQLVYYSAMEKRVEIFSKLSGANRQSFIVDDLVELAESNLVISPISYEYADYIKALPDQALWAHIYTHYLGDMAGGQMLKRCVPGSGTRFNFVDTSGLISEIRMNVSIADATEANTAFEWTIKIYDDLFQRLS